MKPEPSSDIPDILEPDNTPIRADIVGEAPDIILPPKKNVVIDASMLSTLMSCPRKMDFQYNRRFQSNNGKSNSLEVGILVHICLETFYKHIIDGFKRELAINASLAMGEIYVRGCKDCIDKTCKVHIQEPWLGLRNTPMESERYLVGWKDALDTVEEYYQFYKNDFWVPLEIEVVKADILYEDDEIRILWKAKLDSVFDTNQGIHPMDHKTMKQRRNTLSLNNQFMGQCLVMDTRRVFINKIGFQKTLKPDEKFTRVPLTYTGARLLEWQSTILPHYVYELLNYTEVEHFPPRFTSCESKYGDCIFCETCEADEGIMREETIRMNFYEGPVWNPTNEE